MWEIIFTIIFLMIFLIAIGFIALSAYLIWVGDSKIEVFLKDRTPLKLEKIEDGHAEFATEFFVANVGKRPDAMIMDAFARHGVPQEQYDKAKLCVNLEREGFRRNDGYFEAFPFEGLKKEKLICTLHIFSEQPILQSLHELPDVRLDVYVNYVGKEENKIKRWYFVLTKEELNKALNEAGVYLNARIC